MATLDIQINKLQKEVINLKQYNQHLVTENKENEEENVKLNQKVAKLEQLQQEYSIKLETRIDELLAKEKDRCRKLEERSKQVEQENKQLSRQIQDLEDKKHMHEDSIQTLKNQIKQHQKGKGISGDDNQDDFQDERHSLRLQLKKAKDDLNQTEKAIENLMAENRALRQFAKLPDNYGFQLEDIKLAEKQKVEDYKQQVRYLEKELEELEVERATLRQRLRNISNLYSNNPGERYKDLTQDQLQQLDRFAGELKFGKIDISKQDQTKKELEKQLLQLRAELDIYETKGGP